MVRKEKEKAKENDEVQDEQVLAEEVQDEEVTQIDEMQDIEKHIEEVQDIEEVTQIDEVQDIKKHIDEVQDIEKYIEEVQDEEVTQIDESEVASEENIEEITTIEKVAPIDEKENNKLLRLDPYKLKPHPKNHEIYGSEKVDEDLVASIRDSGQLEPIIIGDKYRIISGHRRWLALKKIRDDTEEERKDDVTAICFYKPMTELEELEAIVESNRQRKKNLLQVYKEVKLLDEVYAKRAQIRQLAQLKKGSVVPDPEQREEPKNDAGRTIEKEAAATGIGKTQLTKLKKIGDRCDIKNRENAYSYKNANEIMTELKDGSITIDAAYKKLMLMDIASDYNNPDAQMAKSLLINIKSEKLTPNKACAKFKKCQKDKKDQLPKVKVELKPGMYNVIVANPSELDIKDTRDKQITEARDAALFLWSSAQNLKERIELMGAWGFKLESIAVWDRNNPTSGTWFSGVVEFLLLGIKGDMEPQKENKFPVIFKALKDTDSGCQPFGKNERPEEYVYEMAEKMFPGQQYLDPFVVNGRENWGQSTIVELRDVQQNNDEMLNENLTDLNIVNDDHKSTAGLIPEIHYPIDQTVTVKESELPEGSVEDVNHWL